MRCRIVLHREQTGAFQGILARDLCWEAVSFGKGGNEVKNHPPSIVPHLPQHPHNSPSQRTVASRSWWQAPFFGYASSLLFIAIAFLITWLQTTGNIHTYFVGVLYVIGTFLIAWVWGTPPALLSMVVGVVCIDYLVIPPLHTFSLNLIPVLVDLVPFLVLQLLILWLIAKQKTYASHLLAAQKEIAHYAEDVAEGNQRLVQSNQALVQSNMQLVHANRTKDQFLSVASHELRTPVTSIHGYLQLLMRRLTKQSKQHPEMLPFRDALGKVDEQTRRLTDLVNDLLDLNSLRSGKMPIRLAPVDLRALCREVVEEHQTVTGRMINLHLPVDPVLVHADARRITQVMHNLVSNALKYSPTNAQVCVEIQQGSGEAILAVENEGSVLSKTQQESIFEPFYRCPDVQSSAIPGWGLGLALSKEIVEQHSGRLWVESSQEKGTTFFVALPLLTALESVSPPQ
jgi:signal transduction histidine kinase